MLRPLKSFTLFFVPIAIGQASALFFSPSFAQQGPGYLHGKVEQKNVFHPTAPLTTPSGDDPFSGTGGDQFPAASQPPPPVEGHVGDTFSGPVPTQPRRVSASAQAFQESPELQIAWDAWHQRIGQAVFARFNNMSKAAFKYSEPLACKVSYTVTREGHLKDIKILDPSPNPMFNVLVTTAIKSINGDLELLQFPEGTRRTEVEKIGTFTQNYGVEGFRYTTGDKETVRAKGKQ
jgi:hypothetical protein